MSRYNRGSDDAYWLQLFNGDGIKLNRKSSEGPMTILHPYVSLIGGTQPGLLPELLGGKRMTSGFSSRLLKVFPDITEMPEWTMQQVSPCILDDWNNIVRSILEVPSKFDENGDVIPRVVRFSEKAKKTLCLWRNGKHRREWKETDEDYLRGFYGKLETYAVRFCLVIQVIRSFCDIRCSPSVIDEESVRSAISLAEYFRSMEKIVFLYISDRKDEGKDMVMFGKLPDEFRTSDAHALGNTLGMSESTVKRFLKRCCASGILMNPKHGLYQKVMRKEEKEHVTQFDLLTLSGAVRISFFVSKGSKVQKVKGSREHYEPIKTKNYERTQIHIETIQEPGRQERVSQLPRQGMFLTVYRHGGEDNLSP